MSLTKVTYAMINAAPANVLDYGADSSGVADSTAAFDLAIATGKRVYVPTGTYLINATINTKTVIYGDGSTRSILKPFNTAIAALTYTYTAMTSPFLRFWTYHTSFENLGFFGTAKVGIGFAMGGSNPLTYTANDELASNVTFKNCYFSELEKGAYFPFGNIGTEFYSCGFAKNKYGVYTMSPRNGAVMHAGNKYFYAGEFSENTCGFYCFNTQQGFGGVSFKDTIFESNKNCLYVYTDSLTYTPVELDNCWFEQNGQVSVPGQTVDLDYWVGTTLTTPTITSQTMIFDGDLLRANISNSFFTDTFLKASNSQLTVKNCRAERGSGVNGATSFVDQDTSQIRVIDCYGAGIVAKNTTNSGFYNPGDYTITNNASAAATNWINALPRASKVANFGGKAASISFTSAESAGGSFPLTGSVVSDGVIYDTCNEFTRAAFLSNEFIALNNSVITTSAGYYVFTFDVKVATGSGMPTFFVWDRSTAQMSNNMAVSRLNQWYTFAGIAYSPGGQTLFLDVSGDGTTCTWKMSAFQILRFATFAEAQAFFNNNVYAS